MRRCVDETVAGHDSIRAGAADPVMRFPTLLAEVDKLDPRARSKDILVRGLGPVAAMVEPVSLDVRRKLPFDIPSHRIPAGKDSRVVSSGDLSAPNQVVSHQQIFRRAGVTGGVVRSFPQQLAVLLGKGPNFPLLSAVSEKNHITIGNQCRAIDVPHAVPRNHRFRFPCLLSRLPVQAHDSGPVVEIHLSVVGSQRQRFDRLLDLPQDLSGLGIKGDDVAFLGLQ